MTTLIGALLAAVVGFSIVECLHCNHGKPFVMGKALGVAACLAAHKEGDFFELFF
jgi:hypothetical protein